MVRRKFLRLLNAITALSFFGLLMVYMQSSYPPVDERSDGAVLDSFDGAAPLMPVLAQLPAEGEGREAQLLSGVPSPLSKEEMVGSIEFLNANYDVLNVNIFGPVHLAKVVIVVQVHNRIDYLRYLIDSLEKAKHIEEALLIFSHDYTSPDINKLVKQIRFCRVMQILYPHNIQLFPTVYPGQHPDDCRAGMSFEQAERVHCNNWQHPDKYGHYRVPKITQIKHHWWWKLHYVFDSIMPRYGLDKVWVVLLEEDHLVAPDFLHVLNLIVDNKKELCDTCQLVSLGFYLKQYTSYSDDIQSLGVHPWFSSKHNMGMAFNATTFALIKNCSHAFCKYDDYNWDWSLLHISVKCLPAKLKVISLKAPRVIHVGDCGVHTHRCNVQNAPRKTQELFSRVAERFFPRNLRVTENSRRMLKPSRENGGWGDARDYELCLNNTQPSFNVIQPSSPLAASLWDEHMSNASSALLFPAAS